MWSSTSTTYLDALRAENSEAWTRFLERYGPLIYEVCRKRGVPADDARDLVQEVLIGVHRNLSRTLRSDTDASFHAWLRGIVRFKTFDYFRHLEKQARGFGGTAAQQYLQNRPDDVVPSSDLTEDGDTDVRWIKIAMETVKAEFELRSWTAFWRTAVEKQPTSDVARDLGMSEAAVRQAKCRVSRRLRPELEALREPPLN